MPAGTFVIPDSYDNDLSNTYMGGTGMPRPILAPLWVDASTSGPNVRYATTGAAPNRIFTIEWDSVAFILGSAFTPYQGPSAISVELKLYETSGVIDFTYNFITASAPYTGFLAIGITGGSGAYPVAGAQPFWSLNNTGTAPVPSMTVESRSLTGLPASNQVYRWSFQCAGTPTAGAVGATVSTGCSSYTSVLSLPGASIGAGLIYQWQSSPDSTIWTNIPGATALLIPQR